jgi:hypothetical protein
MPYSNTQMPIIYPQGGGPFSGERGKMSESPPFDRRLLFKRAAAVTGGVLAAGATEMSLSAAFGAAHADSASAAAKGRDGGAVQALAPRVYSREEWAARPPSAPAELLGTAPDGLIVHHTASGNSNDFSLEHAFALSRSIQDHHMDGNGWSDTGQQLTISRGGHVMEGRNRSLEAIGGVQHVVGAHVGGENGHLLGIENEGLYTSERPTDQLWGSLVDTLAWLCGVYGLDPHAAILGHRDFNSTACPGDTLYSLLPDLRDEVAGRLGLAPRNERVTPSRRGELPEPRGRFDHGPAVGPNEPRP